MKPRIQKRKAFTLVEILIVICVISILFVVLVSRVDFATDKARQAGVQNDMHALQYAIHQVALEKGELVDDLNLLASLLNENLDTELMVRVEGNMLKTHATDPWGNEYQLRYNKGIDNKGQLQVLSAGPDSDYLTNDDTVIAIVCSLSASGTNVIVKEDLSTNEIIKEDGTLPNQPVAPEHVCSFSRRVQSAQFLKTAGNCKTEAIYFYSCECGAVGTATFTGSKNPSEHVDNPTIVYNSYNDEQHTKVTTCVGCNVVLDTTNVNHTFNNNKCTDCNYERHVHSYTNQNPVEANKATSATCSAAATYYYTCACGAKGTSTFVSGNALAHNYSDVVYFLFMTFSYAKSVQQCSKPIYFYDDFVGMTALDDKIEKLKHYCNFEYTYQSLMRIFGDSQELFLFKNIVANQAIVTYLTLNHKEQKQHYKELLKLMNKNDIEYLISQHKKRK